MEGEHVHPNSITMASEMMTNLDWSASRQTEGMSTSNDSECVIERIRKNMDELNIIKLEIQASKRRWFQEITSLSQEYLDLIQAARH